ncbi:MAG: shikimate kinase [Syntrophobacteraceae bacterium]
MRNIALIGFRATGKSAVGAILADELGRMFIDMDKHLTASAGREIACWVRLEGWDSFRKAETELLDALASKKDLVVATGGGVVLAPENRMVLKRDFFTIWLRASADTIYRRMTSDPQTSSTRPAFSELPLEQEIRQLLRERESLYAACADLEIATDCKPISEIAVLIATRLESGV